jgi:hypothetical protein
VGSYDDGHGSQKPLVGRWEGKAWTIDSAPNPADAVYSNLNDVSCPMSTFCAAAGFAIGTAGIPHAFVDSWSGRSWTLAPSRLADGRSAATGVACLRTLACTVVGNTGLEVLADWWSRTAWHSETTPTIPDATRALFGGVSCPSLADCFAVGSEFSNSFNPLPLVEHYRR